MTTEKTLSSVEWGVTFMSIAKRCAVALVGGVVALMTLLHERVRGDDAKASRWEKEVAAFEKQDAARPPAKGGVVFVGSSSIRLWKLEKSFPGVEALNRGFGGSQIIDSVELAPRLVVKYQPRLVVFYAGDNDIGGGKTPEKVLADFKAFVAVVHKDLPKTRIAFLSVKPSVARWKLVDKIKQANALIEAYCKETEGLVYIDVFTPMLGDDGKPRAELLLKDGLHMNEKGYEIWAERVKPLLSEKKP
jgi:lysophospholipase L1-like esterase